MTPRLVATIAAVTSIVFGILALFFAAAMAGAFGVELDETAAATVRMASAAYLGFGVLNWLARDLVDSAAWRAIAIGNATAWGVSAVVAGFAILSGLGNPTAWLLVALQIGFVAVWLTAYARSVPQADAAVSHGA